MAKQCSREAFESGANKSIVPGGWCLIWMQRSGLLCPQLAAHCLNCTAAIFGSSVGKRHLSSAHLHSHPRATIRVDLASLFLSASSGTSLLVAWVLAIQNLSSVFCLLPSGEILMNHWRNWRCLCRIQTDITRRCFCGLEWLTGKSAKLATAFPSSRQCWKPEWGWCSCGCHHQCFKTDSKHVG